MARVAIIEKPINFPTSNVEPISVPRPSPTAFTLNFTVGTKMREVQDQVIQTLLSITGGNRLRAAELLGINPRTIRRHLGRKETQH